MREEKILVVEDEKSIASLIKQYLAMKGYDVIVAEDGDKALSICYEALPQLVIQIVDLAQLLREIVDEYRDYPQARKISWNVVIEPESANVLASPEELKKAIGNVIDNALKFTRQKYEDEDGGFISVSLIDGHTHWRIQISDNGVGISEDMTEGIYERFQRGSVSLKGRRKTIGYGLGLAITKNIIEAHGGLIELTSKAEPTTFTISLPKLPEKNRD